MLEIHEQIIDEANCTAAKSSGTSCKVYMIFMSMVSEGKVSSNLTNVMYRGGAYPWSLPFRSPS